MTGTGQGIGPGNWAEDWPIVRDVGGGAGQVLLAGHGNEEEGDVDAEAGADLAPVHGPGGQRADHDEQDHEEVVPPARSSVDAE